ncbi:MAG: Uncharacterized protein YpeB [uncultured Paraburkholderia sp.]|nr:MAG: Uncharacterized protein YpeB [uncultured Paraburkholderia sp.]
MPCRQASEDAAPNLPCVDRITTNPEHLELLVTHTMPYGKYKGRLIADLPGHYLNWFASQGFPPGEIGRLLALMHEIDHKQRVVVANRAVAQTLKD